MAGLQGKRGDAGIVGFNPKKQNEQQGIDFESRDRVKSLPQSLKTLLDKCGCCHGLRWIKTQMAWIADCDLDLRQLPTHGKVSITATIYWSRHQFMASAQPGGDFASGQKERHPRGIAERKPGRTPQKSSLGKEPNSVGFSGGKLGRCRAVCGGIGTCFPFRR